MCSCVFLDLGLTAQLDFFQVASKLKKKLNTNSETQIPLVEGVVQAHKSESQGL